MNTIHGISELNELDLRKKSRIAAFWYLLILLSGPFLIFYLPSKFIVAGDATATIANITASQPLFRFGIVVTFVSVLSFLFTAIALYELFKSVDKGQARAMLALVAVSVPFALFTTLFQIAALVLTSGADFLNSFTQVQLQTLAMTFLNLEQQGGAISGLFWGLWLLPLGILIFKSDFFPKFLGVFEVIACFGYLAGSLMGFLLPGIQGVLPTIANVMVIGELPFILWLIIRGARLKVPPKSAPAEA